MKPSSSNSKTVGILQPSYMPWLGFFEQLYTCDIFVLYDDVQFEKGSWRNRNRIKTDGGPQWLTVPVMLKGKDFPVIKDVIINQSIPWHKKHIKSVTQNYSKAPFFELYADKLFKLLNKPCKYLIDLNFELIHWLTDQLNISTPMVLSSELNISGANVQRLIDIIQSLQGNHFYEGSAGREYIDVKIFEEAGITVTFQDYNHPVYPQLHGDFISHLSIIDLLFNCGSESLNILSVSKREDK
ncbi:MAG: WbqC family protein [Desulfobacteraceae bacterium]|nr:WbqC family protein [Desulfobacteraceae bacterium]